jgi:hypothetical protein
MNRTLVLGACIVFAGCASSRTDSHAQSSVVQPPDAAPPVTSSSARTVDMASLDDEGRCRTERPTGSRIAVRRCDAPTAAQEALQETLARREVEDMRQRQMYQEQSRRAMEAAMRQRVPSR